MIGALAGILVPLGIELLEYLRIDDPIGALAGSRFVRGLGNVEVLGLFATGTYGLPTPDGADTSTTINGLFYGGGWDQLKAQFIGSMTCVVGRQRR